MFISRPPALARKTQKRLVAASEALAGLRRVRTLDDFVYYVEEEDPISRLVSPVVVELRNRAERTLRSHDVHVGRSIVEGAMFDLVRAGSSDPLGDFYSLVEGRGFHEFGFVLYPLHSFGVLHEEPAFFGEQAPDEVVFPDNGVAITPQLNSAESAVAWLRRIAPQIGVTSKIPADVLFNHLRNPVLDWVTSNPLMVIRVRSYSAGQYENQNAYADKLALGTALVMMAAALTDPRADVHSAVSSTARVNNFETLDIRHYLVFENAGTRRKLEIRRVPMNLAPQTLAQLSDLAVDLDPQSWRPERVHAAIRRLSRAVALFEPFRARYLSDGSGDARTRVARKIFDSVFWFRRSCNSIADPREAVVAQAVAFEVLLTDSNVSLDVILEKLEAALAGQRHVAALLDEVDSLFEARNEAVHAGAMMRRPDLALARRAYVGAFMHIAERLGAVPLETSSPIADMLEAEPC